MERQEFLTKFGLGVAALCAGCGIASCGSGAKNNDPTPTPGSGALFSVNLDSELLTVGSQKVSNGVIIARIAAGNLADAFSAVQVACTHQGASIAYHEDQGIYKCPLHGSEFSKTGAVVQGPAAVNLKKYNVIINGSSLSVSA